MSLDHAEFHAEVYRIARLIPEARVTSYGHIAKLIGMPRHSRFVGQAMKYLSPEATPPVPWQRVIASSGRISPREPGSAERQRAALEAEGVEVVTGRGGEMRIDLARYGWFPTREEVEEISDSPPQEEQEDTATAE